MKKLLITGASGYLGYHCCKAKTDNWNIIAAYFQNKKGIYPKTENYQLNLSDKDSIWKALKELNPSAVFHLAAYSATGFCEKNPEKTHPLNVTSTGHLAEMCAERKIRLLFTSSEQVFDGTKGNYSENDKPNPKNKYGGQKLEAEKLIQDIDPTATIIRIAVLFGEATPAAKSFLNQWTDKWENDEPVTAFFDEIRPFLSGSACADGLFHLLNIGAEGVFHLGGKENMSRYDFALKAKEILGYKNAEIIRKSQKELDLSAYRPADLSLNCKKITGTGYKLRTAVDELIKMKNRIVH